MIIFMLITGGSSPFYSSNKMRMQKRILNGNYNIEDVQHAGVSRNGKDLVRALLVVEQGDRLTGQQCREHNWLGLVEGEHQVSEVRRLETQAMRRWLARRRWNRAVNIIRATIRLSSVVGEGDLVPEYLSSEQEIWL